MRNPAAFLVPLSFAVAAIAGEPGTLSVGEAIPVAAECLRDAALVQASPAVAFGKKVYLIAWSDGSRMLGKETADIYCARIEPGTGKSLDPKGIVVCKAENLQSRPAVAFDGTNFLVAWEDLRNGTDHDIYAARVSEEGKVLDPNGFPVIRRPNNQAWAAVAFAAGNYIVAWMDARQYPVYGIYFARVSPEGKVLDSEGLPADIEDATRIAKARPSGDAWMGDQDYWWNGLASRICPAAASNGSSVLLIYTKEYPFAGSGRPGLSAVLVGGGSIPRVSQPVKVAGGPAPAWTGRGWALGGPAWQSGWTPTPFLGAAFLPETPVETKEAAATLDVVKAFGGGYNVGKGSTASFWSAAACNSRNVLVAMGYAWREKTGDKRPVFAILALRVATDGDFRLLDPTPVVVASASSPESVSHPAIAAGPDGEWLLAYQWDTDVAKCLIAARIVRER